MMSALVLTSTLTLAVHSLLSYKGDYIQATQIILGY